MPGKKFHNPYTFVPTPPRGHIARSEFAGDFDPLKCGLDHASLKDGLWTGHIPIKLTTVTPLVLLKTDGEDRDTNQHQTDVLDYLPESSLRGMLRSAYEVVTNSRYGCFGNSDRLAYRMRPQQALELIPAIIENGNGPGKLMARLYTGTSQPTAKGPKTDVSDQEHAGAMYAAMLTLYHDKEELQSECDSGYTPKTGHEVWAQIVLCKHNNPFYLYWKVIKVWPTDKYSQEPTWATVPESGKWKSLYTNRTKPFVRIVKGHILITNKNMGNKHDERIFFFTPQNCDVAQIINNPHKITYELEEAWRMRIKSYREAHTKSEIFGRSGARDKPWKYIDKAPGKTAWSPHQYQDREHREVWRKDPHRRETTHDAIDLKPGDMVYARCKFDSNGKIQKIEDLFPVMISRELYEASPEDLLDDSLKPAKQICELSPADRLFGWVLQKETQDQEKTSEDADESPSNDTEKQDRDRKIATSYKSRLRVVCDDAPRPDIVQRFDAGGSLPLTILGQPKPAQGRFYVAKDGKAQDTKGKRAAGYEVDKKKTKSLRGRKQYWHHKGLEAELSEEKQDQCYWEPSSEDRTFKKRKERYQEYRRPDILDKQDGRYKPQTDSQNRSITGWIAPGTEFKASLYVQNLQPEEIGALLWLLTLNNTINDSSEKYYFRMGYGKPLGFGSVKMEIDEDRCPDEKLPLGTRQHWKEYYGNLNSLSAPTELDKDRQESCIKEFKVKMEKAYPDVQCFDNLPFISGFLQVLKGPEDGAPIHYPRTKDKPDPAGENFKWFDNNEKGPKLALPAATAKEGLPYQPKT